VEVARVDQGVGCIAPNFKLFIGVEDELSIRVWRAIRANLFGLKKTFAFL